ncbi:hypothetical protein ACQY0O_001661 [Thecaphora frezii]
MTVDLATSAASSEAAGRLRQRGYDPETMLADFGAKGYVIVDGILSSSPDSRLCLESLRSCAEESIQLTRSGHWTARRVVGNAFPPFDKDNRDSWGVQHIMNPQLDRVAERSDVGSQTERRSSLSETFQEFYASSPLLDVASLLVGAPEERMQMELFNLLINPESHYFALAWHRDDIKPDVGEAEERQRLDKPTYGVQFNTALYDDDCLFIVPGSHQRLRNAEEKAANLAKAPPAVQLDASGGDAPNVEGFDGSWKIDPPGTLRVQLKAGQTVFYSQRILHRASYLPSRKRATLHACYGDIGDDAEGDAGGAERARNILQHGVEWMRDEQFGHRLPQRLQPRESWPAGRYGNHRAEPARLTWKRALCPASSADGPTLPPVLNNLIRMEKKWAPKNLGFSLDN